MRKFNCDKIEKFKNALKAIHTGLIVSEAVIYPRAIIKNDTTKQAGLLGSLFGASAKDGSAGAKVPGQGEPFQLDQGQHVLSEGIKGFPLYIDGV